MADTATAGWFWHDAQSGEGAAIALIFADPILFPPVFPYGLEIVRGSLSQRGLSSSVVLPYLTDRPADSLKVALQQAPPRIVGFSFRNLDEAGFNYHSDGEITFIDELVELVGIAKSTGAITCLGGSGFSIAPSELLNATGADFGFVGSSEVEFATFCQRILRGGQSPFEAADGLTSVMRPGGPVPKPPVATLGLPLDYNPTHRFLIEMTGGTVGVRTKSGCTLRCTYCVVPWIEALNLRPWEDIRAELRRVVEQGLGERIFIADGEFNLPDTDYAINICRRIKSEFPKQIAWRCYIDGGHVTAELVTAMKHSGCVGVSITADAYSTPGRIGHAKQSSVASALEATQRLIESGIGTTINVLFGGPKETVESALETAEHTRRFHDLGAKIALTIGLRVYPGTPLARIVTNPRFRKHYHPLKSYPWLGVFCSPMPRDALAKLILPILPAGNRIAYTNTLSDADKAFYREIARGAMLLTSHPELAVEHFSRLGDQYPMRREALLGHVRATELVRAKAHT